MKKVGWIRFLPNDATYDEMDSPVGLLTIITSSAGLHAILWDNDRKNLEIDYVIKDLRKSTNENMSVQTKQELAEYFQGKRTTFNLPLVIHGTDFQLQVWQQLRNISYATTISYGEQAARIGNKNKARAVGMTNGLNPISIVIPCHRVIGSNGHLVGFGGGVERKAYLLQLEQKTVNQ